ncbi:DUF4340 domain-containing protein [bacterium]|nr:DUF4340 domain-containing protein [Mariniblastus sp.]MDA7905504.1 DUF4340 domain-containing protein [Mariniblastus sp.]MDB4385898.1 DUF4340 domain-containing protein [bacterium]
MNEIKTTFTFLVLAAVLAVVALGSHFMNQPTDTKDFELVGQPFFENFDSASQAQSLMVSAVDDESGRLERFEVKNQNGLWRIPSEYDYPAEAADRLATTASSVMGIVRESLAGRLSNEHAKLGVLDPLADDIEDPDGVGKRITLKGADDEVVVDLIIGKEAGDVVLTGAEAPFGNSSGEKYYFVRNPEEQQTYKVKLKIDLSTKFSDWIDPDLLRIDPNLVTAVTIDNYSLEEDQSNPLSPNKALFKAQGDKIEMTRESNTEAWKLEGLISEVEELETPKVTEMLAVFDQLKIAGVRPKSKYKGFFLLTPELKLNIQPEFETDKQGLGQAIQKLQGELDQKGFNLAGTAEKMELVSQNGDVSIGTDQGVLYTLSVGATYDGEDTEIEIGSPDEGSDGGDESGGDSKEKADVPEIKNQDRYMMVRVSFDESLISQKPVPPVAPVAPEKPAGYLPAPEKNATETEAEKPAEPADDVAEKPPGETKPERDPAFIKYDRDVAAFEGLELDYELAKTRFETETVEFQAKIAEGKKLVAELNERFGDWYYVISGENLSTLQSKRSDLVKTKPAPAGGAPGGRPNLSFPNLPILPTQGGPPAARNSPETPAVVAPDPPNAAPMKEPAAESPTPKAEPAKDADSDSAKEAGDVAEETENSEKPKEATVKPLDKPAEVISESPPKSKPVPQAVPDKGN